MEIGDMAPDFSLTDTSGQEFRLSEQQGHHHVMLVFNRGLFWPFCTQHLAQLRQDHDELTARGAMVAVVAPEDLARVANHWVVNDLPFAGLADPDHQVARLYEQPFRLLKLGRLPSVTVVDRSGRLQFIHLGRSMRDIPTNQAILKVLDELQTSNADSPTDLGT